MSDKADVISGTLLTCWHQCCKKKKKKVRPGGSPSGHAIDQGGCSVRFRIGMLSTATRVKKKKGGRHYTFCPILMKNRGRNTTFSSFLPKYKGRNYMGGQKWVSPPPPPPNQGARWQRPNSEIVSRNHHFSLVCDIVSSSPVLLWVRWLCMCTPAFPLVLAHDARSFPNPSAFEWL